MSTVAGMGPHLGVHGGGHQHRGAGHQQGGGEQVIGTTGRGAGQQVRGGRGDDDEIGTLAGRDMRDTRYIGEDVGRDGVPGQRLPGGSADELQRTGGRDDSDVGSACTQPADQLTRLVGRDPAANAEDHPRHQGRGGRRRAIDLHRIRTGSGHSPSVWVSRPALISRSAIDSGFSLGSGSTSGPTYSSSPSPSWA